jgi:hypothetical protein
LEHPFNNSTTNPSRGGKTNGRDEIAANVRPNLNVPRPAQSPPLEIPARTPAGHSQSRYTIKARASTRIPAFSGVARALNVY